MEYGLCQKCIPLFRAEMYSTVFPTHILNFGHFLHSFFLICLREQCHPRSCKPRLWCSLSYWMLFFTACKCIWLFWCYLVSCWFRAILWETLFHNFLPKYIPCTTSSPPLDGQGYTGWQTTEDRLNLDSENCFIVLKLIKTLLIMTSK